MKGNFDACLAVTLAREGKFVDDPHDPGGRTMRGVTQRTYDAFRTGKGLTHKDVRVISDSEVAELYKRLYWDKIGADALPLGVDLLGFDAAVNQGVGHASAWLAASRDLLPGDRIRYLDSTRMSYWKRCKNRAGQLLWRFFGKGWTNREDAVFQTALRMQTPRVETFISPGANP